MPKRNLSRQSQSPSTFWCRPLISSTRPPRVPARTANGPSLLAFAVVPRTARTSADETAKVRKKNSSIIVAATAVHLRGAPVADVDSLDALVEVAKKYETMILELPVNEHIEYLLWDDGLVYRFRDIEEQARVPSAADPSPIVKLRWDDDPDTGDVPIPPPTA